jgi:hypothetical protein
MFVNASGEWTPSRYCIDLDEGKEVWKQLCAVAQMLIHLPASEAICQRIISIIDLIFPKARLSVRAELMTVRLKIRLSEL